MGVLIIAPTGAKSDARPPSRFTAATRAVNSPFHRKGLAPDSLYRGENTEGEPGHAPAPVTLFGTARCNRRDRVLSIFLVAARPVRSCGVDDLQRYSHPRSSSPGNRPQRPLRQSGAAQRRGVCPPPPPGGGCIHSSYFIQATTGRGCSRQTSGRGESALTAGRERPPSPRLVPDARTRLHRLVHFRYYARLFDGFLDISVMQLPTRGEAATTTVG